MAHQKIRVRASPRKGVFLLCVLPKVSPICFHNATLTFTSEHNCRTIDDKDTAIGLSTLLTSNGVYIDRSRCHNSGSKKLDRQGSASRCMAGAGPSHAPNRALHAGHSSDARDDLDASLHTDHHPAPPFLDDRLTPTDSIAVSPHR